MKIDLTNLLFPFLKIDLTNPHLGSELLKDPKGDFPLDVWEAYCTKSAHYPWSLLSWRIDPSDPKTAALNPQQALDEALSCANETVRLLMRNQPADAFLSARRTVNILLRGSSFSRPKKGQPASMRPVAVRAWIIRRFNPPSKVRWRELADMLFRENGKCPRSIHDDDGRPKICGESRHKSESPCVKALRTAVGHLKSAMKHEGIPLQ